MNRFWDLVEKSTITSAALAIMMSGVVGYCVVAQIPLPDFMIAGFTMVLTFFFTSKLKDEQAKAQGVTRGAGAADATEQGITRGSG